ncbi:hypothetical protein Q5424_27005, partial [Conexibacter sp. JD483]
MTREEERDERLGAALRGLDVPEHGPDFAANLRARLEQEEPAADADADSAPGAARPRRRRAAVADA